jgi:hypothetical protein
MALGGVSDVRLTTPSSPTEVRRKVGRIHHFFLSARVDDPRRAYGGVCVETLQSNSLDHRHFSSDGGRALRTSWRTIVMDGNGG